jgi:hypothetical protein
MGPGISHDGEIKTNQQSYQKQMASTIALLLGEQFETDGNNSDALFIPIPSVITGPLQRGFLLFDVYFY